MVSRVHARTVVPLLLALSLWLALPALVHGAECQLVLGFKTLQGLVNAAEGSDAVGSCLENERHNSENGDGVQRTTGGLLFWRKADNFTAFTDGHRTWTNGPNGLQSRRNTERFAWETGARFASLLSSATYPSEWEKSGTITLADGRYEGQPFVPGGATRLIVTLVEPVAAGDLDGDGIDEAVAILAANPGGSGTFLSLEAMRNEAGQPRHIATHALGDRVRIRSFRIEGRLIVLEVVTHGPSDARCCPTQIERITYRLEAGSLVKVASEVVGTGSEQGKTPVPPELLGAAWYWQRYEDTAGLRNITVADPAKYTLEFRQDKRYLIRADCNTGSGAFTVEGGSLTLGQGPMTLAACEPDSLDTEFLRRLGDVRTYVLVDGELALNLWADAGNMIFSRDPAPSMVSVPAPVETVSLVVSQPEAPQYALTVISRLPRGSSCSSFEGYKVSRDGSTVAVTVTNLEVTAQNVPCTADYPAVSTEIPLGADFQPGTAYTVVTNGAVTNSFVARDPQDRTMVQKLSPIEAAGTAVSASTSGEWTLEVISRLPLGSSCSRFDGFEVARRFANTIHVTVTHLEVAELNVPCTRDLPAVKTDIPLGKDFSSGETYTVIVNDSTTKTFVPK
ncbi:MAG: hypothetical protein CL878_04015 [Dehalococcoidia bacterium]|nr:hypothetical protein [Dehalococcoidia bacterium]